jgi:hypothetical protein
MATLGDGTAFTHAILTDHIKQAYHEPSSGEAEKAKALINFLMQDRFFLALYRSNDPKVRAAALNELNQAHHQAYGDAPPEDACRELERK